VADRRPVCPTSAQAWWSAARSATLRGPCTPSFGGHTYRISPGVFWQVHAGAAAALLSAVLDLAGRCAGLSVVDLYAGAGLFSVPLADAVGRSGSVLAVERDRRACADARHNGSTFPNLRVLEGDVTPAVLDSALGRPDIVVLDPAARVRGPPSCAPWRRTHPPCAR